MKSDVALRVPALLVLAPAVEQIENRIAVSHVGLVVRRRVYISPPPFARDF